MRNLVLGAMTLAFAGIASPSMAANFPICAFGTDTCAEACDFVTVEQCRATILGSKGYCGSNPRYTPVAQANAFTPRPRR
jgi:hypothetical protein